MRLLRLFLLSGLLTFVAVPAYAANFAVITSPPTALSVLVLFAALGCIVGAYRIANLLKGGYLAKSWQIFIGSFLALGISQLGVLLNDFEIYPIPQFVVPALLVLALGLFMFGIFETKRTLE